MNQIWNRNTIDTQKTIIEECKITNECEKGRIFSYVPSGDRFSLKSKPCLVIPYSYTYLLKIEKPPFLLTMQHIIQSLYPEYVPLPVIRRYPANTQHWINVYIFWNNVATSISSTLIQRRFVKGDSSIKFNVETTLILGWL